MPPNDPQWGKRPSDGPPDLDEILKKLNQKLAGLFARRPMDPSGPTPPSGGPGFAFFGGSLAFIVLLV
ncbi:MAG TPA: protease modulator HflK N-terminal domain-containing protein, partial [Usitatibacteraceae bacterium]|nr:protease modulator HflK N-terminal domain-containing protein [Usitatibacteraceae bacterium]